MPADAAACHAMPAADTLFDAEILMPALFLIRADAAAIPPRHYVTVVHATLFDVKEAGFCFIDVLCPAAVLRYAHATVS